MWYCDGKLQSFDNDWGWFHAMLLHDEITFHDNNRNNTHKAYYNKGKLCSFNWRNENFPTIITYHDDTETIYQETYVYHIHENLYLDYAVLTYNKCGELVCRKYYNKDEFFF